jgi:hypothetical protein
VEITADDDPRLADTRLAITLTLGEVQAFGQKQILKVTLAGIAPD